MRNGIHTTVVAALLLQIVAANAASQSFTFYGKTVKVDVAPELYNLNFPDKLPNTENLTKIFQKANTNKLYKSFEQLNVQALEMNLDHMGTYQLYRYFVLNCFPQESQNFKKAMVWYGLRKSGIDAVMAGYKNYLNLYLRIENPVDGGYFITVKGQKYYSADASTNFPKGIYIFDPRIFETNSRQALKLDVMKRPILGNDIVLKKRSFYSGKRTYTLNLKYNNNYVNYLNDLPSLRTGSHMYKLAPSDEAQKSMDDSVNVWLKNKTYDQKLSFLLKMAQEAFSYKADTDYRKTEKRNFIEQTLADDFTDCEDRAAFFSYLASRYLKTESIIMYSKEKTHVNCAIQMSDAATGFTFKYNNKKYLIMEPAYINFRPGETDHSVEELQRFEICN